MREIDKDFEPPQRIFGLDALAQLLETATVVDCECPNHLAALVSSLLAFEEYSKNCEDKNEADAHIHSMLYRETSQARARLEAALLKLCEAEEIEVETIT